MRSYDRGRQAGRQQVRAHLAVAAAAAVAQAHLHLCGAARSQDLQ